MFIVSLIFLLAGVVALVVAASNAKARVVAAGETPNGSAFRRGTNVIISRAARWAAVVLFVIGAAFLVFSSFFRQDVGQANVLRDWTGQIVGYETQAGLHWKAPWVVDIAIRYSLDPDAVIDIYSAYYNEENLRTRLIFNDIRSVVRSVPGRFDTIDMLTDRNAVQDAILEALEARWENDGIIVEDVALQEIRYGESVTAAYAAAQEAQINVQTEQARLEAVQVSAQQKIVQAQAEAEANAILNASLTDAILQQRYLDTLKELAAAGNLVIVPEGFSGLINVAR
jgi:regulator of protease activity HflC (stomatin/prohibitin superfamily)